MYLPQGVSVFNSADTPTGAYEFYANGDKIVYSYNSEGNLTSQTKNGESAPYVTYEYNSDGDLTQKTEMGKRK